HLPDASRRSPVRARPVSKVRHDTRQNGWRRRRDRGTAMRTGATGVLIVLASVGCVRLRPGAGFEDVQRSLSSRTAAPVIWRQGTPADAAKFEEHLRALLAAELTPESAVEIALFNSPALQATYERLGIAQADLVQAGLFPNPVLHASLRFGVAGPGPGGGLSLLQDFIQLLDVPLRKRVAAP